MKRIRSILVVSATSLGIASASAAGVHRWDIHEFYTNVDGSIQFIELMVPIGDTNEWFFNTNSVTLTVEDGTTQNVYAFDHDLDTGLSTAFAFALLGTTGFADLGVVEPDWIIPDGFLLIDGGTASLGTSGSVFSFDTRVYAALPTDGLISLNADGTTAINSPTNFAGKTGVVPEPATALLVGAGLALMGAVRRKSSPSSHRRAPSVNIRAIPAPGSPAHTLE